LHQYDRVGDLIDLFVVLAWNGLHTSGEEGYEAVPALPAKKQFYPGMDVKCEKVHERLDVIGSKLTRIYEEEMRWLERNIGTN